MRHGIYTTSPDMVAVPASGYKTRIFARFRACTGKGDVCKDLSHLYAWLASGIRNLHHALNDQRTGTSTTVANTDHPDFALVVLQNTQ